MAIHVIPLEDTRVHDRSIDCWCEPRQQWIDDDGIPLNGGPLVVHTSADGRELIEALDGESMRPNKLWGVFTECCGGKESYFDEQ